MAVWQYDFKLISSNRFKNINIEEFIGDLEKVFGEEIQRNDKQIIFGDFESHNLIIYIHNGVIDEISCRLDMRNINQKIIHQLKEIVVKNNLKFLIIEETVLDGENFVDKLKNSSSVKFVSNPSQFFQNLTK